MFEEGADGWREVEEDLRLAGMAKAASAVAEAQAHGLTVSNVAALLAHWRRHPGAWGIGALHDRICSARPGDDTASFWPPVAEAARRDAERSKRKYYHAEPRDPAAQAETMSANHEIFAAARKQLSNGAAVAST